MCGIVGIVGSSDVVHVTELLLDGLQKLEYRGYDSAGIYVTNDQKQEHLIKVKGRVADLRNQVSDDVQGSIGIAHTRWATHGEPSINNAHPHVSENGRFYLVHNGVIENYQELKAKYLSTVNFKSDTDSEVAVQLVQYFVDKDNLTTLEALRKTVSLMPDSAYGFLLIDNEQPDKLYVAKRRSPLLIALGDNFNAVCSDALAMIAHTNKFVELHDGEVAVLTSNSVDIQDGNGNHIMRDSYTVDMDVSEADKGAYEHYMLKEIDEQPVVIRRHLTDYFDENKETALEQSLINEMAQADRIYIIAAGTSYHAGLVGKRIIEKLTNIPVEVNIASEFAYNYEIISEQPFFIFISQSGETADLREVLNRINKDGYSSLTITNVKNSTLSREATYTILLKAGPEIAVASTKAYTAQISIEAILAKALGMKLNNFTAQNFDLFGQLSVVANAMQALIDQKDKLRNIAEKYFVNATDAFYIGRGIDYAVSLEASLKLKEISYLHSEGIAAGELKHGPIALIENGTPVVGILTQENVVALTRSNLAETQARGSKVLTIAMKKFAVANDDIVIDDVDELLTPLLSVIPAQLISYYTSLAKGLDVDKPRNLAKSVTVQ